MCFLTLKAPKKTDLSLKVFGFKFIIGFGVFFLKNSIWSSNLFFTQLSLFKPNLHPIAYFLGEGWIEKQSTGVKNISNIGGDFEIFLKISF